ncbi:MAG TPA: multifunctional oxoglutarate decarboxylase/oxoglutarate dehydrogenase thiamine pyrophosphate-binding subunit/dihydrolipoyllysine-residue succinyltransferase subunit, partial [Acidimicrobiia bacterium]|nr:multifunctional oxoglutarate decarboxylase/oxoglutarate dehydrogenase thiamine pyrophosphate-binding subunit/dihydrolipoyllysine-residue succinyltransferase subunit [Acidimicrobiia bacterium]
MSDTEVPGLEPTAFGSNLWIVDEIYQQFLEDPESVSESWRAYFNGEAPRQSPPGSQAPSAPTPITETRTTEAKPELTSSPVPPPDVASASDQLASETVLPLDAVLLRGAAAVVAERMEASREIPTATSVRNVPAKLLEVNRLIINNQLRRLTQGGKISFTHLIGYAVARAFKELPHLNVAFAEIDDKPYLVRYPHVNLGLAIDVERKDGSRGLVVPNIKEAESLDFRSFWLKYEELVDKARTNRLTPDEFAGTTVTLTNPGTIGTVQSVPRLMPDQGVIVGVGAIAYPPEFQAADAGFLARQGIGRVLTLTSTYDHRVIQGAQSGELLARVHELLLGEGGFYDEVFAALAIPYTPARWAVDDNPPVGSPRWAEKQANVFRLINAFRVRGHLIADLDPLRQHPPRLYSELDPLFYGLTIWDLDREFATGGVDGMQMMTLGKILARLRDAYCRTAGIEYMHMQETEQKRWIQERCEGPRTDLEREEKIRILRKLNQAEAFEKFLHTKYVGHKRFGLEGSESVIPMLDSLLSAAADDGMEDVVIGMAHRGRLNILANVIGKSFAKIFREFEGDLDPETTGGSGDVKYHLGASGKYETADGSIIGVQLVANPSHLEAVDPVLEGVVRAKQEKRGPSGHTQVLPVLIHGDAAFAGQGVVAEVFNLSQLRGYRTGGTVHIVINNQVGFTTSALDARSSFYATDVAKTVAAPIIHVNGDDPEAVVRVARLAFDFRQAFHRDVVIDMICYRRRGHNEGDEPSYTQPLMYKLIDQKRPVRNLYSERLIAMGDISMEEGESLTAEFSDLLNLAFKETRGSAPAERPSQVRPMTAEEPVTAVTESELREVLLFLTSPPADFVVHPKLRKVLEERAATFEQGVVDWGTAEALALGAVARAGFPVRLAGEDSRRGTFSHRHAELTSFDTGVEWAPLQLLTEGTTRVRIVDSLLSEFAAVGFEYGYSVEWNDALVAWEAQFGDFANGAQVIIDQFIAAGEAKWGQQSGLVLLLPHGYEGQGPEHSSGRIERFLGLCADENMRVVVPSTSGQYFHLLRRQALLRPRKPLIVFTPKSLLRTRESFSSTETLWAGKFEPVLEDDVAKTYARRLVLCSGKVYHD